MRRTILLIVAAAVGVFLSTAGVKFLFNQRSATLLTRAPTHGTAFILEMDDSTKSAETNGLAILQEAIRKRAAKVGVGDYGDGNSNCGVSPAHEPERRKQPSAGKAALKPLSPSGASFISSGVKITQKPCSTEILVRNNVAS